MDLISSNIGNGDGEIPSSNPVYTDFDQKRQTSDHGKSIHIQILPGVLTTCSQLLAKIAGYLVNLLGIFTDGVAWDIPACFETSTLVSAEMASNATKPKPSTRDGRTTTSELQIKSQ